MIIEKIVRWRVPLLLALLTLLYFRHVLLPDQGEALAGSDFKQFVYPIMQFMVRSVRQDRVIPLWNPHQFLGYSVVGNPQYLLFYVPNWLLLAFGEVYQGVGIMVALHTFWAAWGMARLAEVWGAKTLPAVLAGVVFAFGGFPAARIYAGHYAMLLALAWMPWVMAAYRLSASTRQAHWAVWGGVALAWQIAAGHPQLVYLTVLGLALQIGYEALGVGDRAAVRWVIQQGFILGLIGIVLSAVSWLPIVAYNAKTVRGVENPSLEFANEFAVPANQLTTLVVPDLYGNPLDNSLGYWGEPFYEEMTAYVGWLPVLGLLLAPLLKKREAWFFIVLIVVGIVLSLGIDGGLLVGLYRWLPLVQGFRSPGRALILSMIGLAGLLALVITRLMENSRQANQVLLRGLLGRFLPLGLVMLWGASLIYAAFDDSPRGSYRAEQLALSGLFLALAGFALWAWTAEGKAAQRWALAATCLVAVADVWRVSWGLTMTRPFKLDAIWREAAVDVPIGAAAGYGRVMQLPPIAGTPQGASWTGHLAAQGYDPLAPVDWARLAEKADFNPTHPINRIFGVRYALAPLPLEEYGFPDTAGFELIGLRPPFAFYENKTALPRAYLVSRYEVVADDETARQRLAEGEASAGDAVLLSQAPPCEVAGGEGEMPAITRYTPNEVVIHGEADGARLLVLSDQYDEDWQVSINGQWAELLRVNTVARGACVPDGEFTARFQYRPHSLYVGGAVSALGGSGLLVWLFYKNAAIGRPRRRTSDQHD